MAMSKKEILKLLEKGEISVEEAMKMMDQPSEEVEESIKISERVVVGRKDKKKYKYLIIKVNNRDGSEKVNVTLPVGLLKYAKSFSGAFVKDETGRDALSSLDLDEIMSMMEQDQGDRKIIDVQSDNESVEIYFE